LVIRKFSLAVKSHSKPYHKSYPFTNPTPLVSLLPPGLPPRTFPCTVRLSWPSRQLLSARKSTVSYRISIDNRRRYCISVRLFFFVVVR